MNIKREILKTYNKIAEKYDREFSKIYYSSELNFFLKQLPKKAKILDVGCGPGNIASFLEKQGFSVTGIDFSDEMIQIAKKKCKKSEFIKADIEQFDYGVNKWDGIIAAFILLHLKKASIKKLLNKFYKVLNRNGVLFISMIEGSGEYLGPEPLDPGFKMYFNYTRLSEMQKFLKSAGFEVIYFKKRLQQTESMNYTGLFLISKKIKKVAIR